MTIKNIVFDIGNVLVKWAPQDIISQAFTTSADPNLMRHIFKSPTWLDLNKGFITEDEAIHIYEKNLGIPQKKLQELMGITKESLLPIEGSIDLVEDLHQAGFPLYSITDNVHEIMTHLRGKYSFFTKFSGIVVSADLGVLKPSHLIYDHLLKEYNLKAHETVFIDDLKVNVEGAIKVGMWGIEFTTAKACKEELKRLGVSLLSNQK